MPYSREVRAIQNDLQRAWAGIRAAVQQMYPAAEIRPRDAVDVFRPDAGAVDAKFDVGPVVFKVPERPNVAGTNLYIVVNGWITFAPPRDDDPRRTTQQFGTGVGYFRATSEGLVHVYGAHFDIDEERPGHPVFHMQMTSQLDLQSAVEALFHQHFDVAENCAEGLLRNVRTPTAQMDAFAVITQIGADHLVSEASGPEVHAAFGRLRSACDFFLGAGGRMPRLNSSAAARCYRSTHWYRGEHSAVQ